MEDGLGESNESESGTFVNTDSDMAPLPGGEESQSLVYFRNHLFPVCTRVNID
jgi:hypothetical protein